MAFASKVIDVPVIGLDQAPPDHGGPSGRATTLKDVQVTHYTPPETGVVQKVQIEPREAFVSMPTELRDSVTGAVDAVSGWSNPELLAALGDQLFSVCNGRPRAFNGSTWTSYPGRRVVPNKLSQSVLHTASHTIAAPDSARVGSVTCFVWTEASHNGPVALNTSMIAFRGDDGAWIRVPAQLFQNNNGNAMVRVVQDGTFFWVIFNTGNKIAINVHDTHGALVASDSTTISLAWTPTPGYWDVVAPGGTAPSAMLVQPHAFTTVAADVGLDTWSLTVSGSVISIAANGRMAVGGFAHCSGPCAWIQNTIGNGLVYCATVGAANHVFVYESGVGGNGLKEYDFGAVLAGSGIPDSITGWVEPNGAGTIAHVAYSLLSNFSPPSGSPNDPGLRYTRSYACTRAGVTTQTNQVNGLLLSSRAFQVDNDWYAACYYQGGGGLARTPAPITNPTSGTNDYFTGDVNQPVTVQANDFATGAANVSAGQGYVVPTQAVGAIAHTAGDAVAGTGSPTWSFAVAPFLGTGTGVFDGTSVISSAAGSLLHITGAANAQNNGDWWVTGVISNNTVQTEATSLQGNTWTPEAFGGGVAASLIQVWPILIPQNPSFGFANTVYPDATMSQFFLGGAATIAGATGVNAPINGTYSIFRYYTGATWRGYKGPGFFASDPQASLFLLTKTSGAGGVPAGNPYFLGSPTSFTISPALANAWALFGLNAAHDTRAGVTVNLVVTGAHQAGNNGVAAETASPMPTAPYGRFMDVTGGQTAQRAELFLGFGSDLPTISRQLADPSKAFTWVLTNFTFDSSYVNGLLTMTGSTHAEDNGLYQITAVLDTHTIVALPVDARRGQTLYNMTGAETITVSKAASSGSPAIQPAWYLMPLSIAQKAAGRFEWGQAYGDWRFDGEVKANLGTFERNGYPLALSSVTPSADGKQFALPYRAQSFTAGQIIAGTSKQTSLSITQQSTVGLKLFDLAAAPGLAIPGSDEMLLPGAQASQFSATGVTEHGINVGPEKPWLVSQGTTGTPFGLTLGASIQYAIAFELLNESGDRVWSTVSPTLDVQMTGTQNQNTIAGRMPGPTDRVVTVAIYRTANVGGVPTIQHLKITNDLDVNGTGFTFTSVNGGADSDTWQYVDGLPDAAILSAEPIYTDKGLLQRFPAPAYSQGISGWKARDWVVGYDGAVWMSGEHAEGDAVWFHPAFRYTSFGDDVPVSVCPMDDYLVVHCKKTIWYIPATTFPDATGKNGTLPTPVKLPFTNGGTGFSKEIRAGVVYSSSAGGAWLITRDLRNVWLSQPVRDSLTTVAGMAIDVNQRLFITTGAGALFVYDQITSAWWQWTPPNAGAPSLVASYQGRATYAGPASVVRYAPGLYLDTVDSVNGAIVPLIVFSSLNFGGIRSYKRLWACQIVGTYKGPHRLIATMNYPDDDHAQTSFGPFVPSGSGPYAFEINPMLEEASSFGVTITCDFVGVGTPGNSFALECLSFEIGIDPGLNRNPASRRIPGS